MKNTFRQLSLVACMLAPVTGLAFEKGDILIRGGLITVAPDESSSNVFAGDTDLGFGVTVDDNTQLMLNAAYFLTDSINLELLAATPFSHDVSFGTSDPLGTGDQLGELKHLPPTLTVNYYIPAGDAFKPYVGIGLNYTIFFDEEFTGANEDAGLSDLSLDDSFGIAAQVGADYMLTEQWFLNAALRWIDIDTEATFNVGEAVGRVDSIEVDPWVYSLGVGYKF
jgi:outer membrane protein